MLVDAAFIFEAISAQSLSQNLFENSNFAIGRLESCHPGVVLHPRILWTPLFRTPCDGTIPSSFGLKAIFKTGSQNLEYHFMNDISETIAAVVFDLDGLMFNTEDIFDLAGKELLKRRGKEMTKECHHRMLGRRPHEAFAAMKELMNLSEKIEDLMSESKDIFQTHLDEKLKPMAGLFELLNLLEERELPKAVATSSPRNYLYDILSRFDVEDRFVFHLTAEDVVKGKPHPEIYLKAAEQFRIAPQQMLVLEDSETGSRAASSSGAIVVSIPHRHTAAQDFGMATHIAEHLMDPVILQLLK